MNQTIVIDEKQAEFVKGYSQYGFKNKDDLVKEAINRLQNDLRKKTLEESADLYAEIYSEDADLRELTRLALSESVDD